MNNSVFFHPFLSVCILYYTFPSFSVVLRPFLTLFLPFLSFYIVDISQKISIHKKLCIRPNKRWVLSEKDCIIIRERVFYAMFFIRESGVFARSSEIDSFSSEKVFFLWKNQKKGKHRVVFYRNEIFIDSPFLLFFQLLLLSSYSLCYFSCFVTVLMLPRSTRNTKEFHKEASRANLLFCFAALLTENLYHLRLLALFAGWECRDDLIIVIGQIRHQ